VIMQNHKYSDFKRIIFMKNNITSRIIMRKYNTTQTGSNIRPIFYPSNVNPDPLGK
jgi:hypothetical protein